jgi:hypothetical protein
VLVVLDTQIAGSGALEDGDQLVVLCASFVGVFLTQATAANRRVP